MATWIDAKDQRWAARITAGGCTPDGLVRLAVYLIDRALLGDLGRYVGTLEIDGEELDLARDSLDLGGMSVVEVPPKRGGRIRGAAYTDYDARRRAQEVG